MVSTVAQICRQSRTSVVRAALIRSGVPSVPATFQGVSGRGSCPREHAGWNVLPLDQQLAPPPYMQAHPPAGLACFTGVSLHRLLPRDAVRRRGRDRLKFRLPHEMEAVPWPGVAANAIRDKRSDAHWPSR